MTEPLDPSSLGKEPGHLARPSLENFLAWANQKLPLMPKDERASTFVARWEALKELHRRASQRPASEPAPLVVCIRWRRRLNRGSRR